MVKQNLIIKSLKYRSIIHIKTNLKKIFVEKDYYFTINNLRLKYSYFKNIQNNKFENDIIYYCMKYYYKGDGSLTELYDKYNNNKLLFDCYMDTVNAFYVSEVKKYMSNYYMSEIYKDCSSYRNYFYCMNLIFNFYTNF